MFGDFDRGSTSFNFILLLVIIALVYFFQNISPRPMGYREASAGGKDERDNVEKEGATILYSRVIDEELDASEENVIETITEEKPQSIAQVLFSRIVGRSYEEEKPYKVLYSRSIDLEN